MTFRTAAAFDAMKASAAMEGIHLKLNSGFRTMTEQAALYAKYLLGGPLAAKPGHSNHQAGDSVDIDVGGNNPNSITYRWLAANAGQFGFENDGRYFSKPEFWHWTLRA
jgi:LAS superfamily LD-carboxypeptidase LdcB